MLLLEVCRALSEAEVRFAVAGGHAVALHGAVRGTVDIDIVVHLDEPALARAEAALRSIGLASRLPLAAAEIAAFREEYLNKRNLKTWTFVDPDRPSRVVDILLTDDAADLQVKRLSIDGTPVPIVAKKDLIGMKKRAGRPQDLEDARALGG